MQKWHERALCLDVEPTEFDKREGVRFCVGCPVIRECALDALENRSVGVVRAGVFLRGYTFPESRRDLYQVLEMV